MWLFMAINFPILLRSLMHQLYLSDMKQMIHCQTMSQRQTINRVSVSLFSLIHLLTTSVALSKAVD